MCPTYPKTMEKEQTLLNKFGINLDQLSKSQAVLQDYENLAGLNRGHLNPSGQHSDSSSRTATFTLTNIVPQDEKLNGGTWNNYGKQAMMRKTQGCNTTYVVVGAVPGKNYIAKGRVNIPSYLWSSACCEVDTHHWKSWAVIAENDKNEVQLLTLGQLEDELTRLYGRKQRNPVAIQFLLTCVAWFNNKELFCFGTVMRVFQQDLPPSYDAALSHLLWLEAASTERQELTSSDVK
ncbi:hypothetical protein Q9966_013940 [Columba livia]|nr:hypothetical protein Q9966_013940 [Columba livia]